MTSLLIRCNFYAKKVFHYIHRHYFEPQFKNLTGDHEQPDENELSKLIEKNLAYRPVVVYFGASHLNPWQ